MKYIRSLALLALCAVLWTPAAAPLWYVSQIAVIERGESVLDDGLEAVLAARQAVTSTAG